jgi:hypothetical protein
VFPSLKKKEIYGQNNINIPKSLLLYHNYGIPCEYSRSYIDGTVRPLIERLP